MIDDCGAVPSQEMENQVRACIESALSVLDLELGPSHATLNRPLTWQLLFKSALGIGKDEVP